MGCTEKNGLFLLAIKSRGCMGLYVNVFMAAYPRSSGGLILIKPYLVSYRSPGRINEMKRENRRIVRRYE
jgi:hypothetical protein